MGAEIGGSKVDVWEKNGSKIDFFSLKILKKKGGVTSKVDIFHWHLEKGGSKIYIPHIEYIPLSKIRMFLQMDAKIWMISLIIMLAVCPICVQDSIFKMSGASPDHYHQCHTRVLYQCDARTSVMLCQACHLFLSPCQDVCNGPCKGSPSQS